MKRRSGLQEEDDENDRNNSNIRIEKLTLPKRGLPSTQQESSTITTQMANIDEETSRSNTDIKAITSSNVDVVHVNDSCNDEKGIAGTETNEKIKQDNMIRGVMFQKNENEEISGNDENSIASHDANISNRPGAFAIQSMRINNTNNNTTEDGTVQYSTTEEEVETVTQTQREQQQQEAEGTTAILNDPLEAERVLETVQGISVTLNNQDDSPKWKRRTIILGIFLFELCVIAAVLFAFFVRSNKKDSKSLSSPPPPPVVATVASPSPTVLPILFSPSMIPSAAPVSIQEQIMAVLYEYFPDLPASNDQKRALDWIITDPLSLAVIMEDDEGLTSRNKNRLLLERFVLATIYFATYLFPWHNDDLWLSPSLVCQWHGIECGGNGTLEQSEVIEINLSRNRLIGSIPTELGLMTSMTRLDFAENQLSGSIPTELGLLTSLNWLTLNLNALTGSIPTELGLLTSVELLYLYNNDLSGTIPTELGSMTSMTNIDSSYNALSGTLPTELGFMTSLTMLYLRNNALSGTIPTEIGLMTSVRLIYLENAILTGSIPTELGLLTRMTRLGLSRNFDLAGTIPSEVAAILPNIPECFMGNTDLIDVPENCRGNPPR